jgi:hypothetical protein
MVMLGIVRCRFRKWQNVRECLSQKIRNIKKKDPEDAGA